MTLIAGRDTYVCDHCGHQDPAPEGHNGYPKGWGIYEHYPEGSDIAKGDLCPKCIELVLPPKKASRSDDQ